MTHHAVLKLFEGAGIEDVMIGLAVLIRHWVNRRRARRRFGEAHEAVERWRHS